MNAKNAGHIASSSKESRQADRGSACTLRVISLTPSTVLFTIATVLASAGALFAQEDQGQVGNARSSSSRWTSDALEPWPGKTKLLESSPAAPDSVQALLEAGDVSFQFYDPGQFRRRFQAETRFKAKYTTRVTYRWRLVRGTENHRTLLIFPRFVRVNMDVEHQVLLPQRYAREDMFAQDLVKHELDHVRISSDESFQRLFAKQLKTELRQVETQPEAGDTLSATAKRAVDAETERVFQDVMDLIRIRYRELDQVTRHGGKPLPAGFFDDDADER